MQIARKPHREFIVMILESLQTFLRQDSFHKSFRERENFILLH